MMSLYIRNEHDAAWFNWLSALGLWRAGARNLLSPGIPDWLGHPELE
jgi:hypothetical protein